MPQFDPQPDAETRYDEAVRTMECAKDEAAFRAAARKFECLADFRDAKSRAADCLERAEALRKDAIYETAAADMAQGTPRGCRWAIELFASIGDWRDADAQLQACKALLAQLEKGEAEPEQAEIPDKSRKAQALRIAQCVALLAAAASLVYLLLSAALR